MLRLVSILFALLLSVPIGSVAAVLGALALEFALGYLVEAGERLESDPAKRRLVLTIAAIVLAVSAICLMIACATGVWLLAQRR